MYTHMLVGLARNFDDDGYADLLTGWSRLLGGRGPSPDRRHTVRPGRRTRS